MKIRDQYYHLHCLAVFIFLVAFDTFGFPAVSDQVQFHHLTTSMGLSHSDVTCFCQDYERCIWIGAVSGLNKYNGTTPQVYKQNDKDPASIPSNYINAIYEDKEHILWIHTSERLTRYNREQDNFNEVMSDGHNSLQSQTRVIFELEKDTLLFATRSGFFTLDKKTNKIRNHVSQYFKDNEEFDFNIIARDPEDNIWFSILDQENGGLIKIDSESKKIERFHTGHPVMALKDNIASSILFGEHENIWIGYSYAGIDVFKKGIGRIASYAHDPQNINTISDDKITSLLQTDDGTIVIGTSEEGVNFLDPVSGNINAFKNSISTYSLLSNTVPYISEMME